MTVCIEPASAQRPARPHRVSRLACGLAIVLGFFIVLIDTSAPVTPNRLWHIQPLDIVARKSRSAAPGCRRYAWPGCAITATSATGRRWRSATLPDDPDQETGSYEPVGPGLGPSDQTMNEPDRQSTAPFPSRRSVPPRSAKKPKCDVSSSAR